MSELKPLVIYHSPCADGFTAAWAAWRKHPDWGFHAAMYGKPHPDATGREVYLLDYSYKLPEMEKLIGEAKRVVVLDHHATAQADIQPLIDSGRVEGVFDMEHSGAYLSWKYFWPDSPVPRFVELVEDRDLWKFTSAYTRPASAVFFSYPYDFETWNMLYEQCESTTGLTVLVAGGEAIERKHHKDISELLALTATTEKIGGYVVPVANLPYTLASDAANKLSEGEPFAATYYIDKEGSRVFSLRSKENGMDVSQVAKQYGGGGHKHAAGFTLKTGQSLEIPDNGKIGDHK
jgi:oligoribonuclease NrnB/cAMP/cGMP phosphodiesterase (DHH superfamily)